MKRAIVTLAVIVMAFGNVGMAQSKTDAKSVEKGIVFRHYGLRNDDIRPAEAIARTTYGTTYRYTYTYDEYDYYLIETLIETRDGADWTPSDMITYEYDFSGGLLEMVRWEWEDGGWEEELMATYTYTDDGMEIVYQNMDDGVWTNAVKAVYNYNGDMTTILYWEWNGSVWSSADLHTYTYSDTSIEVLKQYMQGGAWQNDEKVTYTLDFSGNVTGIFYEVWNNNAWINDGRTTYNFEGGVYTSMLEEVWENNTWKEVYRFDFVYDDGNAVKGTCLHFDDGQWAPDDEDIEMAYNYNAANDVYFGCEVDVSYVDLTAVGETAPAAGFLVYPVPAEGELHIEAEGFRKAEIYSLSGQKLMESLRDRMNVDGLSSGLYVIKVYDKAGKAATQRILVK